MVTAAGFQIVLGVSRLVIPNTLVVVAIYFVAAVAVLLWVRIAIHYMLLIEAADVPLRST